MIGINALQSSLRRIKKKVFPFERKISVIYFDPFTGKIDLPPEDDLNEGVLLIPTPIDDFDEWERFCDIKAKDMVEPIL